MNVLTAAPKHWFSWCYNILDGGRIVADFDVRLLREAGRLRVHVSAPREYRAGWAGEELVLEDGSAVLARARRRSMIRPGYAVRLGDKEYDLEWESRFRQRFVLFDGLKVVGRIVPRRFLIRKVAVELPDEIPLEQKVFLFFLAVLAWRYIAWFASEI